MYLVIIKAKENILDCISDEINSECIRLLEKQSRNIRISDFTIKSDGVYMFMNIINNNHSPTAYVARKDDKIISDFVRQYKLLVNKQTSKTALWTPRYTVEIVDKVNK